MGIKEWLKLFHDLAKKQGMTIDKYADAVLSFEEATATVRSSPEERAEAMDAIRAIVEANPDAVLDPRQVVSQVGLKQCQADRAFVRYQVDKLRLEYKAA